MPISTFFYILLYKSFWNISTNYQSYSARINVIQFQVSYVFHFWSKWNPSGRCTLMVSPVSFILLIFANFVFPSRSSFFKVLSLSLSSNAYIDINFQPFDFTLAGIIWRNTAWHFTVLDMHTFVFSSSVSSTFFWNNHVVKYDYVLHNLGKSIYQHCGSYSGSWNTAFPSPISSFQFLSFLHICHTCKTDACFHRECTLVSQRKTILTLLFPKLFFGWYACLLCC